MKNMMFVFFSTILGTITLLLVMTVYGRINRSMELKSNLPSILEETVENAMVQKNYVVRNTNEMLADLTEALIYTIDAETGIQLDVFQCDKERGILSIEATGLFKHPNGKDGAVTCERTVIFNPTAAEEMPKLYTVTFMVGTECYKILQVYENSLVAVPYKPSSEGQVFYGWLNSDGSVANFSKPILEDIVFYADLR